MKIGRSVSGFLIGSVCIDHSVRYTLWTKLSCKINCFFKTFWVSCSQFSFTLSKRTTYCFWQLKHRNRRKKNICIQFISLLKYVKIGESSRTKKKINLWFYPIEFNFILVLLPIDRNNWIIAVWGNSNEFL